MIQQAALAVVNLQVQRHQLHFHSGAGFGNPVSALHRTASDMAWGSFHSGKQQQQAAAETIARQLKAQYALQLERVKETELEDYTTSFKARELLGSRRPSTRSMKALALLGEVDGSESTSASNQQDLHVQHERPAPRRSWGFGSSRRKK